ncbi:hypothetical protein BGX28_003815 [Mortierella sp. GBA30]|nr:hypothetical protein BGX28_003815 [Mortierella sp. GBA30]
MHKLFHGGRHHSPPKVNKPLPEPLVDPDEGKIPIGELVIVPIQGRDLPNRERFGKQDPFILFKLGNVAKRSSTDVRGGQRPRWKDDQINILMYESDAKDATSLYVTCLDEDHQKNDLIGDCVINLAKVLEQGEHDDWFELSYKGREAGELMLQLTYYSHDPTHPTNKMNRPRPSTPVPASGTTSARRPIHPLNGPAKVFEASSSSATPVASMSAAITTVEGGQIYRPPVVTEPAPVAVPVAPVYPQGGRASPVGQGQYAAQPTQFPPGIVPGPQRPLGSRPYTTMTGFPGYPNPNSGPYPPVDADKRLSLPAQLQQQQQQQFTPMQGYPAVGYPNSTSSGSVYPPQQFNPVGGYPPQQWSSQNNSGGNNLYPPTLNPGYPPQQFSHQGYPPISHNNLYPPTMPQPSSALSTSLPSTGLYPPVGYPFAASNLYPPTVGGHSRQTSYQGPQQPTQPRPIVVSSLGGGSSAPSDSSAALTLGASAPASTTLPGSWPGSFPGTSFSSLDNNNSDNSNLSGHKQSVNHGQSVSTYPTSTASSSAGYSLTSTTAMMGASPGGYPPNLPPRARSASPPALPPRNQGQGQFTQPPSYAQTMLGMHGGW